MKTENLTTIEELFAELINENPNSKELNTKLIVQLQGQVEESLGLLNDVVEELRTIAPEALPPLKSLTLKIFEGESEPL